MGVYAREIPIISMCIYRSGTEVIYDGKKFRVEYTHVAKDDLYLRLVGMTDLVNASSVQANPIEIDFNRP